MNTPDTLQDKLRAILDSKELMNSHAVGTQPYDEAIAQIIQAFENDGYIREGHYTVKKPTQNAELKGETGRLWGVKINSINGDTNIMSGQEFYYRFKAETEWFAYEEDDNWRDEYMKAAKRAAGIDTEGETQND